VKGAFTGALKQKEGKFKIAESGTVFLDEIGEIPPTIQVKLLRVLQDKAFERVGGTDTIKVDVRIIAATNKDLQKAIADKSFREDLFYRLNVITIDVPPLRERREDLPLLIDHFLEKKAFKMKMKRKTLVDDVKDFLLNYDYPGNIRELENIIERAYVLEKGETIYLRDLPFSQDDRSELNLNGNSIPVKNGLHAVEEIKKRIEIDLLKRAVAEYNDVSNEKLAEVLGTSRRILRP